MAYGDGNSVTYNTDFGVGLDDSSNAFLVATGYPLVLAVAFKPAAGSATKTLISFGVSIDGGNDYIQLILDSANNLLARTRDAPGEGNVTVQIAAALSANTWYIVAAGFDANNDFRYTLDGAAVSVDSAPGFATFSGNLDSVSIGGRSGEDYDGVMAWALAHGVEFSDAQLEGLSAGTTDPTSLSSDYFVYWEGTSPFDLDGSASGFLSTFGAGSFSTEGTGPTGWPSSGATIPLRRRRHIGFRYG